MKILLGGCATMAAVQAHAGPACEARRAARLGAELASKAARMIEAERTHGARRDQVASPTMPSRRMILQ